MTHQTENIAFYWSVRFVKIVNELYPLIRASFMHSWLVSSPHLQVQPMEKDSKVVVVKRWIDLTTALWGLTRGVCRQNIFFLKAKCLGAERGGSFTKQHWEGSEQGCQFPFVWCTGTLTGSDCCLLIITSSRVRRNICSEALRSDSLKHRLARGGRRICLLSGCMVQYTEDHIILGAPEITRSMFKCSSDVLWIK